MFLTAKACILCKAFLFTFGKQDSQGRSLQVQVKSFVLRTGLRPKTDTGLNLKALFKKDE
jgi:hypothetical protein